MMGLRYHSTPLFLEVTKVTGCITAACNGLQLLKYHASLENHLRFLKSEETPCNAATIKDLGLLVSGLLSDDQPFCSFGYEELYEHGYITADRFSSVRKSRIDRDIDTINESFLAIDEVKDTGKDGDHRFLPTGEPISERTEQTPSSVTATAFKAYDFEPEYRELLTALPFKLVAAGRSMDDESLSRSKLILTSEDATYVLPLALKSGNLPLLCCLADKGAGPEYVHFWQQRSTTVLSDHGCSQMLAYDNWDDWKLWDSPIPIASVDDDSHRQQSQLTKLECLHHEFSIRIRHAELDVNPEQKLWDDWRTMSSASSAFTDSWATDLERTKRKGWTAGMRVLRRLTRGKMPTTLYDTIMFLTIASAIATTRNNFENTDRYHMARFEEDLSRWELVFATDSSSLRKFRLAVVDLWHVDLEYPFADEVTSPDPDTLIHFQEMAGAIFAMFIAFLLEMTSDKPGIAKSTRGKPGASNFQTPVLKAALQHLLFLLNDNASCGWRLGVESAIAADFIENFSSLKNIADPLVSDKIVSRLSWICSTWKSSYALQETHRMLEVYLGLETFKSIVPHVLLPRAYPLDDPSQESAIFNLDSMSQNIPNTSDYPPYSSTTANSASTRGSPSLSTPCVFLNLNFHTFVIHATQQFIPRTCATPTDNFLCGM
ncbi:hypothetical protein IFR05_004933 [Cadophora sp. M221]|nr:hypothetical protein IFR05_004933 [Cadophora sp. M221]